MPALIAFRAVQGLGAGAVQPMGMTIVGDIYSRRGARQGPGLHRQRVGDVGSLVGPDARRGLLRLPVVALDLLRQPAARCRGGWMLWRRFDETRPDAPRTRIDYAGLGPAAGRQACCSSLAPARGRGALGVGVAGRASGSSSPRPRCSRRSSSSSAAPPSRCSRCGCSATASSVAAMLVSLVVGVLLLGLTSYVPLYAQGVLGHRRDRRRVRAGRDDDRLADRGLDLRAVLPAPRLPHDGADRVGARASPAPGCCSSSGRTARSWLLAAAVLRDRASASATSPARRSSPPSRR